MPWLIAPTLIGVGASACSMWGCVSLRGVLRFSALASKVGGQYFKRAPMADHFPTACQDKSTEKSGDVFDAVTEELKAEFARLNWERERASEAFSTRNTSFAEPAAVRRAREALDAIGLALAHCVPNRSRGVSRALLALSAIDTIAEAFGTSDVLKRQHKFWLEVLSACQDALAKFITLLARSLRAVLGVPLFLDGPELSGYRHRLR